MEQLIHLSLIIEVFLISLTPFISFLFIQYLFILYAGTATGEGRIPYKSIETMKCVVLGLPPGIIFQQPSKYNSKDLRCVYNFLDSIKFINATDSND